MRMPKKPVFAVGAVLLFVAGGVAATTSANATTANSFVPITSDVTQATDESQVAAFLESHQVPSRGTGSTADLKLYWTKQAAYWNAVPWKAVAGQWGCTVSSVSVTFNPVDEDGVRSAGVGSVSFCGADASDLLTSVSMQVRTKSDLISENPGLATRESRNEPSTG